MASATPPLALFLFIANSKPMPHQRTMVPTRSTHPAWPPLTTTRASSTGVSGEISSSMCYGAVDLVWLQDAYGRLVHRVYSMLAARRHSQSYPMRIITSMTSTTPRLLRLCAHAPCARVRNHAFHCAMTPILSSLRMVLRSPCPSLSITQQKALYRLNLSGFNPAKARDYVWVRYTFVSKISGSNSTGKIGKGS
ncbi:hypothetical protein B0H13DRAFT_2323447 [Mycena leptocephala]|nr:hypothetical protein B0H13DRAFT_2350099 [Mycena leptocephala]KAJ7916345.1 hypothetical protein B0H13DRAFT_2323447 [Mycena leptocephala]